ncbi:MAG: hypothetical protein AAF992_11915 [Bacteroidota bacterium]
MKTRKSPMTETESWEIIQNMIANAKQDVKDDGYFLLLWGWLVLVASIGHYLLLTLTDFAHPYAVWSLMLVGIVATIWKVSKYRKQRVKTYVGTIMQSLWLAVFVGIIITLIGAGFEIGFRAAYPIILILYGIGIFISGSLFRFTPLIIGAVGTWSLALVAFFVPFQTQLLLLALATMISYIIPGFLLKSQYTHE